MYYSTVIDSCYLDAFLDRSAMYLAVDLGEYNVFVIIIERGSCKNWTVKFAAPHHPPRPGVYASAHAWQRAHHYVAIPS